jgi:hypothetical protein
MCTKLLILSSKCYQIITYGLCNYAIVYSMRRKSSSKQLSRDSRRCSCGKVRFRYKEQAIEALHRIQNNASASLEQCGTTNRHECRCYECGICQGWHLTSRPLKFVSKEWRTAA